MEGEPHQKGITTMSRVRGRAITTAPTRELGLTANRPANGQGFIRHYDDVQDTGNGPDGHSDDLYVRGYNLVGHHDGVPDEGTGEKVGSGSINILNVNEQRIRGLGQ